MNSTNTTTISSNSKNWDLFGLFRLDNWQRFEGKYHFKPLLAPSSLEPSDLFLVKGISI
jgi:hypothetical protein